jgi:hypothetical protein
MTSPTTSAKTNLPAEPNDFVGRERDVDDLRRMLSAMRAVTLCGPTSRSPTTSPGRSRRSPGRWTGCPSRWSRPQPGCGCCRSSRLLRRLSVFSGWTLDQAERVCADDALPVEDVLDLLTALVDKSLVTVMGEVAGETRFRMLDGIRRYAAERLDAAGETARTRSRHRDAVLETAERYEQIAIARRPATWSARVDLFHFYDADLGNVRSALGWSLERGDVEEGLRICSALRTYWIVRGRSAEWAEWTDRFLGRADDLPPGVANCWLSTVHEHV